MGALLELLLILANIGTAVVIVPIMRRFSDELAIGYVAARIVESRVHPRRHRFGARDHHVAAVKDWTFLLGPGWVVGWGNGLILGYLMYRSRLVPRRAAWLGLVGGPLIMFGGNHPSSGLRSLQAIVTIPEAAWELFLGIYCTIWGFRESSPLLRGEGHDRTTTAPAAPPA